LPGNTDARLTRSEASSRPNGSLCELSDHELLEGLRAGSEPHFTALYDRYFQRIYAFVHSRIRNHADAEEIVQETFVTVFKSIENYRGQASLLSWIFGIAKNLANNSIRRRKTHETKLGEVPRETLGPRPGLMSGTPEENLHLRRFTETVRSQLSGVSEWQAEIFAMRHFENLSIPEIARRTDRTSDAIRSSLYRVKRMVVEAAELGPGPGGLA
jgi:RNA polymerase sigma-70 factor (ECF subfamily)